MIHSLKLKNFRAYRNQSFEFSRLNIFVGANNSGKSSALSAINFIAQSVLQGDLNAGPIAINGPFEQLGTFLDVVHGNRATTPIGFEIEYGREAIDERHRIAFEIKYRSQRKETEISSFDYAFRGKKVYSYKTQKDSHVTRVNGKRLDLLVEDGQRQRPRFTTFFPIDQTLSRYSFLNGDEDLKQIDKKTLSLFLDVDRRLRRARTRLRETFSNFDSISPFRDQPQRTFLFTGETPARIGRTGSNGISLLVNDVSKRGRLSVGIIEKISEWLSITGIAKGIELRPLTERHFEICILDLDGKRHNICDVGFGCSQVLPVLVGALNTFLSRKNRPADTTFVVQEPEIHLHPNAQAALGSFFASLSGSSRQIFIETHSDNLILRIATHVAAGHLNAKDIAIFFCENREGTKIVEKVGLDQKGVFHPKWPGGFFPQREREALALLRARRDRTTFKTFGNHSFLYPEK